MRVADPFPGTKRVGSLTRPTIAPSEEMAFFVVYWIDRNGGEPESIHRVV